MHEKNIMKKLHLTWLQYIEQKIYWLAQNFLSISDWNANKTKKLLKKIVKISGLWFENSTCREETKRDSLVYERISLSRLFQRDFYNSDLFVQCLNITGGVLKICEKKKKWSTKNWQWH